MICNTIKMDIISSEKIILELLEKHSQKQLLSSYKFSAFICVKYLLNEEYSSCTEDTYICDHQLLLYQTHLTIQELRNARITYNI
jgi:hypothetical protein